jgi:hypothetical protein
LGACSAGREEISVREFFVLELKGESLFCLILRRVFPQEWQARRKVRREFLGRSCQALLLDNLDALKRVRQGTGK